MHNVVKNIKKTLIWALPAVSLVVFSNTFFPFISSKAFLFRVVVELIFFLYVALAVSDSSYRPKWNALTITFAIFTLVMLVADVRAIDPAKALWSNFERMDGFVTLAHLFAYFIVATSVLRSKRDWRIWKLSAVAISIYMIFFCFLQLSGEATINQGGARVDGSLGNAAYLGTYLVFQFFFLAYLWLSDRIDFKEISMPLVAGGFGYSLYYLIRISHAGATHTSYGLIILAVALSVAIIGLVLRLSDGFVRKYGYMSAHISYFAIAAAYLFVLYHTATRGAILGLIGGLFFSALYFVAKERENKFARKLSAGVLITVCLLVGGFYLARNASFVKNSPVLSRFASLSLDTQGQSRNYVWPMAIKGAIERPVLGWGQEGFSYVFQKYYVPEMVTQEPYFDRAHNSFLDWLVAGGVLGFLAYLALYLIAFMFIWRSLVFSNKEKAALLGLILAYSFQNLFIFDNLISYILFVSFLAIVSVLHERDEQVQVKQDANDDGKAMLLASCLVGFVIISILINLKGYQQNTTLIQAISPQQNGLADNLKLFKKAIAFNSFGTVEAREQLLRLTVEIAASSQVPVDTKIAFADLVNNEMENQIKATPEDAKIYFETGDFLVNLGAYDQAIPKLEKALKLSPKKQQISFSLAQAYLGKASQTNDAKEKKSDNDTALSIMKAIYEQSPNIDAVRIPYVSALAFLSQVKDSLEIAKGVNDLSRLVNTSFIKSVSGAGYDADVINLLKKAIEQNSQNADAYTLLADMYLNLKDPQKAIAVLEDMAKAIPSKKDEVEKDIATVKSGLR